MMESSKEGSWTKADVSLGIPFMGFKKRMICTQAKMKQEGPHQRMIKGKSRWGMYALKFSHVIICILLSHGNNSITWSSIEESLSPRTCSKACTTLQWRSIKGYTHIRSIILLTKKQEEMLTIPRSKQWRNVPTRSIRWLTNLSKEKQMKKEIKHVKNTMITENHYLTRYFEDIS